MEPERVVRQFFERMQARSWGDAAALLARDVRIEYTATGEVFEGSAFIKMNEAYPAGWDLEVQEVIGSGDRVAAQVTIRQGGETFWCAGFYTVTDGRIANGREHWVTERSEPAPTWRRQFVTSS